MQDDALAALPSKWRERLARKTIVPIITGMSGVSVFHLNGSGGAGEYLKIGIGRFADLVHHEVTRTKWLASVGIRVPDIIARLLENDLAAALMTDLGSQTADNIGSSGWQATVAQIGREFARLHSIAVKACPFDEGLSVRLARAGEMVRAGLIDPAHFDERNRGLTPGALYDRLVASVPEHEDLVLVHGDADLSNLILSKDGQVGFVDCGNAGKADRYVDLAVLTAGLEERFGAEALGAFSQGYGHLPWDSKKTDFYLDLYELF